MSVTSQPARASGARLVLALLAGAVVSVALGTYGRTHTPTGRALTTFGFSGLINMKVWLTTAVVALALVQLVTALKMYGRLGRAPAPPWLPRLHKASGALAVVVSLPVAFHCLWALGFQSYDARVLVHSLLGCLFYGAFVAKVLALHLPRLPGWAIPWLGGLTFTAVVALWLSSSLWFFATVGFPAF